MKKHVSNYFKRFNIGEQDIVYSELSGSPANDLHHIEFGRFKRSDEVENIIALTREEHNLAHGILKKEEKRLTREYLQRKHNEYMARTN